MASNSLDWIRKMNIAVDPSHTRKSSIICTIGPNVASVEMLTNLRRKGMNIVRLNFSHGSHEYHQQVVDNARRSLVDFPFGRTVAIALDTKGPEIRTGLVKGNNESIKFVAGTSITITSEKSLESSCDENTLYVDYEGIVRLAPGKIILVEDGNISFKVESIINGNSIKALVMNSHLLSSRKNVNLPGTEVLLPAVSEKDILDLKFAVKNGLDMVFASFIRRASDVVTIRKVLGLAGKSIKIISKIENWQGIENFDEILQESDGIMVARGDLGMEIPLEKVFVAQKMMITKCNLAGKPVICATQMLESMTYNARPTRAEVSDVANAILDGADCVMLSGETAKGLYPLDAVEMMHRCCLEAESVLCHSAVFEGIRSLTTKPLSTTESIACSAVSATLEQGDIAAIFVLTTSGDSARLIAKYRPIVPVIAVTKDEAVARQIHLSRGCFPVISGIPSMGANLRDWQDNVDTRIHQAIVKAIEMNLIPEKCKIIAIQGWRCGSGKTNNMRILDTSSFFDFAVNSTL